MKKLGCLMALLLLVGVTAKAQDSSKAEVFVGYSYFRFNPGAGQTGLSFNGGVGSFAYNITHMFSAVGEVGGYQNGGVGGSGVSVTTASYLFGPKISKSVGKITPFAQTLLGGAHAKLGGSGSGGSSAFALAVGGGVDFGLTRHLALRVGQLDYVYTRFIDIGTGNQNNFRYSGGIVVKF